MTELACPTNGETTPIVAGFYPDPTICRVGNDYYLAHSSFEYFPGAPIWHSTDLVAWTQIGNILTRRSQFARGAGRSSAGIYGSTLRFHEGEFWFVTTNLDVYDAGQLLVHCADPAGPWSEPVFVSEAIGIDPDLCWGEDGTCYLTWHALDFATGEQSIRQAPINPWTGRFTADDYPVWQGSGMPAAEGPHLYHVGQWWYLVLAEGGTERGHCVTIARAPRPDGPFESCPDNPVLTRRSTVHPVQNTGHADLVQTPDGAWAAVYLGARPRGSTPGFHVLGRETFLAGIDWVDDWPHFASDRYRVPAGDRSFVEEFGTSARGGAPGDIACEGRVLDHRWVVPGGQAEDLIDGDARGGLVLRPAGGDGVLCFRVTDLSWSAEAEVSHSGRFQLRLDGRHLYSIEFDGRVARAVAVVGGLRHEVVATPVSGERVTLRIEAVAAASPPVPLGHGGPDDIVLGVVDESGERELTRLDGRYLSTEVASGFTGRVLGIGAMTRPATVHRVSYVSRDGQDRGAAATPQSSAT